MLHLACISNDASFELDEKLSKTINFDCFEPMVIAAKKAGVKRFVYCSSSSVYGVQRFSRRDRGPPPGAAHALQQVQGHVRTAAVEAQAPTTSPAWSSVLPRSAATARARVSTSRSTGPPPMKWSDSKYGFAIEEDCNGEEETQAGRDRCEVAAG